MTRARSSSTRVPAGLRRAVTLGVLLAALWVPRSYAGTLYAGPADDPAFATIAPRLLSALYPEQRLDAVATEDEKTALDRVAADASSAAVADLATMLDVIAARHLPQDRLEFHGPVGAHCLLGFARRDGWVHAFSDLTAASGQPKPIIGLAGPDANTLFDILRRLEPGLNSVDVQTDAANQPAVGGARGAPDLLLLAAEPDLNRDLVERLADNDHLVMLPVVTRLLSRAALDRNSGFTMQPVQSDSGLLPWSRRPVVTLCTPLGVVLRGDAPPSLRDAVNRAAPAVAAALRPSLADQANAMAKKALHQTVDTVQQLLDRLRAN